MVIDLKNYMILIIKGIVIGFGKVLPGVSGSLLAITLNVYEECLDRISHFFSNFKSNLFYLTTLGIGILFSIILGSKLLLFLLTENYFLTMTFIIGLMLGIVPSLLKEINIKRKIDYLFIMLPLVILVVLEAKTPNYMFTFKGSLFDYLYVIIMGFIEALTTIIPGISGTATYMLLGCYNFVLELFSNPFSFNFFLFFIGLFIGVIIISMLMNYCFKNHKQKIYLVISSLTLFSIFIILKNLLCTNYSLIQFIIGLILIVLGYKITKILNK